MLSLKSKTKSSGRPFFVMQLCKHARHLEVQFVCDEHGNAVELNSRDCSTQRRLQMSFDEGPPTIAKPDTFKEMQRAAQRLTQSIGYMGAGTFEFLYNSATDSYFPTFYDLLELSRLSANFDLERTLSIGRNTQIYIGTERMERPSRAGSPQVVFVRAISSHSPGLVTEAGARKAHARP